MRSWESKGSMTTGNFLGNIRYQVTFHWERKEKGRERGGAQNKSLPLEGYGYCWPLLVLIYTGNSQYPHMFCGLIDISHKPPLF